MSINQCSHVVPQTIVLTIAVKVLGMLHFKLILSHCIQVDIERFLFSLAVKLHNLSKNRQKVINSSMLLPNAWLLWKKQSQLLIWYHHYWWIINVWLIFNLQKNILNWLHFQIFFTGLKNGSLNSMLKVQTGSLSMQFWMYHSNSLKGPRCVRMILCRRQRLYARPPCS